MHHHETKLRVWVGGVITTLWAISFFADLFMTNYDPPPSIGALMLLVAGALYGREVVEQIKKTPENKHAE